MQTEPFRSPESERPAALYLRWAPMTQKRTRSASCGQFQPIHGAGHFDIGKNETNILTGFENGNRLVRIVLNEDSVSGLFKFFRDEFSDQDLIFDN